MKWPKKSNYVAENTEDNNNVYWLVLSWLGLLLLFLVGALGMYL